MKYAKDLKGDKIHISKADRETNYFCLICNSPVVVKKGKKKEHHYAHLQNTGDDCELKYKDLYENHSGLELDKEIIHNEVDYNIEYENIMMDIDTSELSEQQKEAWKLILNWLNDKEDKQFVLSGVAGTGKSFLLNKLREYLILNKISYNVMTYTGKAVDVLKNKGIQEAETIHSTIYKPILDDKNNILGWRLDGESLNNLILVDEYSMVGGDILKDLRSFNKKILFTGDSEQLPPIKGRNELQEKTNYFLTKIVRQAESNPIIKYANFVREGGELKSGIYEKKDDTLFATVNRNHPRINDLLLKYDQVLCGTNKFRHMLNSTIRYQLGYKGMLPNPEEKLICLKNNRDLNMFNGQIFENKFINFKDEFQINNHRITDIDLGIKEEAYVSKEIFYEKSTKLKELWSKDRQKYFIIKRTLFADFAYAISVHKSQGSEFDSVLIFAYDGKWMKEKYNKWLYTAISRSVKKCVVII